MSSVPFIVLQCVPSHKEPDREREKRSRDLCRTGKAEEALRRLRGLMGKRKLTVMLLPLKR